MQFSVDIIIRHTFQYLFSHNIFRVSVFLGNISRGRFRYNIYMQYPLKPIKDPIINSIMSNPSPSIWFGKNAQSNFPNNARPKMVNPT